MAEAITILIADDNRTDRMILSAIVKKAGHHALLAEDGLQAVAAYKEHRPQMILLDALMPNLDGFGAASQIKQLAGEEMVPIIFLTSLTDAESLARCISVGGDDFLSKPYNRVILQAKVDAFTRMRKMHAEIHQQRNEIRIHNEHLIQEQEAAKTVFDNVAHSGCLQAPNIKMMLSPMAVFNGDVLLAARKPSGGMLVLMGDFTGHGLPAAIGAMPMAEIFYGMTGKGFSMMDILREINQKLKRILPPSVFCCACMVDMNFRKKTAELWLGGLPDCLMYRNNGEIEAVKSKNLPLGVLESSSLKDATQLMHMKDGDRFFMWSDGVHEAGNPEGEMFGGERLFQVFQENEDVTALFEEIQASVEAFVGTQDQDDDITIVEVIMCDEADLAESESEIEKSGVRGPLDWSVTYELRPQTLKTFNPLPLMLSQLMEVPGLRPHSGQIYTILAELYSNALEHGILGLDSKLKGDAQGFAQYYGQREKLLSGLDSAFVRILLDHTHDKDGGLLCIRFEDSGKGFDHKSKLDHAEHHTDGYCGRGMPLIADLCEKFSYHGRGNLVQANYRWHSD